MPIVPVHAAPRKILILDVQDLAFGAVLRSPVGECFLQHLAAA
jgi:hypothetical protein